VLLDEVLETLSFVAGKVIIDGTFGAGGYSLAMLKEGAEVIAIDRDPNVVPYAKKLKDEYGDKFSFISGNFSKIDTLVEKDVDAIVLDIGVSSMQLDEGERGFSFMRDGLLDMRMSAKGKTAADIVNSYSQRDLADLLFAYGEEKRARRIAKAIIDARAIKPLSSTLELANLIEETVGKNPRGNHPATKSFQALRIGVNEEFDELVQALFAAERKLHVGGVLAIVSFHSLEDRIVKRFFASSKSGSSGSRHLPQLEAQAATWSEIAKAKKASSDELAKNPRSRSATLRSGVRTDEKARGLSFKGLGVPLSSGGRYD
jgi:16S rRNA (cytosine1402-N4)-methyltransferase